MTGAYAVSRIFPALRQTAVDAPSVIILVLDALSALNMSLYGYRRGTTPNIERFARRANVYHAHYAAGTFTTSGTASLLTGTYPWTHRAINIRGLVRRSAAGRNIFNLFSSHYRAGFTQNYLADYLLAQFENDIERHYPVGSFSKLVQYIGAAGAGDAALRFRVNNELLFARTPGALISGTVNQYRKILNARQIKSLHADLQQYSDDLFFHIQDVFSGLAAEIKAQRSPSLFYAHLYPPHEPYLPQSGFDEMFNDSWNPVRKPRQTLWKDHSTSQRTLNSERRRYDQYLANTDFAFGQFIDALEASGLLENSYLVLTSDHGESFERGYLGHSGPYVYEPSIRIPLLISAPGQRERQDIFSSTSNVDLLPTLLYLFGYEIPEWCEGVILPGFAPEVADLSSRPVFSVDAKENSAFGNLTKVSIAMRRGRYKLILYKGYNDEGDPYYNGVYELYDLANDPEELVNLIDTEKSLASELREQMQDAFERASGPP